jgi:hypothetical protein
MVISFFLCLGGYGQAAQVLDRVSLTVTGVDTTMIGKEVIYNEDELYSLIGQTLDLFIVVYDNESPESSVWYNDTGEYKGEGDAADNTMDFMSDGSYLLGHGLLRLLDIFNFVQPAYPYVRQVYAYTGAQTVYDYVFWEDGNSDDFVGSGFSFDFNPDPNFEPYNAVTLYYKGEGDESTLILKGETIVERVIINRPPLPPKAKAPNLLPIGGIR